MSVQKGFPRAILSLTQRKRYEREISARKAELSGEIVVPEGPGNDAASIGLSERRRKYLSQFHSDHVQVDAGNAQRQIRRLETILRNGAPDSITKGQRTRLEKEAAGLREWLQGQMVPRSHAKIGYSHPDFQKTVNHGVREHSPEFSQKADRFKNIMREIAPDDPNKANLESIRPENS